MVKPFNAEELLLRLRKTIEEQSLQDKRIRRLGGTQDIPINARLIAATNTDLELAVKEGRFREDLFYRFNVVKIAVPPPLRERLEDVPLLIGYFIEIDSELSESR